MMMLTIGVISVIRLFSYSVAYGLWPIAYGSHTRGSHCGLDPQSSAMEEAAMGHQP
jgi:hypothetical protein